MGKNSIKSIGIVLGLAGALYAGDGKSNNAVAGTVDDTTVGVETALTNNSSVSGTTEAGNIYAKGGLKGNEDGVSAMGSVAVNVMDNLKVGALVDLGADLSKAVLAISTAIADGSLKVGYRSLSENKDYSTTDGKRNEDDRQNTVMLEYKGMLIKSLATYAIAKGYYSQVDSKTLENNIYTMSDADFIYTYNQLVKLIGGEEVGFEFGLGKYIGQGTDKFEITLAGVNTKYDDSTLDDKKGIAVKGNYEKTINPTTIAKIKASIGDENIGSNVGIGIEKTLKSVLNSIGLEVKSLTENIKVFADLVYNFGGKGDDSMMGTFQLGGNFGDVKVVSGSELDPYAFITDPGEKSKFVKLYEEINGVPYDIAVLKNRLSDLHIKLYKKDFNSKEDLIRFMEELANIKPIDMKVVEKTTLISKVAIPKPPVVEKEKEEEKEKDEDKEVPVGAVDAINDRYKTGEGNPLYGLRPMENDKNGKRLAGIGKQISGTCTIDGNAVNFVPAEKFTGEASCEYQLEGLDGKFDWATMYFDVEGPDTPPETQTPPTMGNLPDKTYTVGQSFTYDMKGDITRTNNDDFTCNLETGTLPSGVTFDATACTISGTLSTPGAHSFSASATDNDGKSGVDGFTITGEAAANQAPVVDSVINISGNGSGEVTEDLTDNMSDDKTSDSDLTVSVTSSTPSGITISGPNSAKKFTAPAGFGGDAEANLSICDGEACSNTVAKIVLL